jgi:hypothetical protein
MNKLDKNFFLHIEGDGKSIEFDLSLQSMKLFRQTWQEKLVYFASMILSKTINGNADISAYKPQHILCIKQDEIGDVCYSLHVFDMLRKQFLKPKLPYCVSLLQ